MFRPRMIPFAMGALLALGGGALASPGEKEKAGEVAAALAAKVSPAQAIAIAEQQTGGRALKIDVEHEKGAYLYEIKTISGDRVAQVFVDTATGKVVRTDDEGLISRILDREDKAELVKLTGSPTTLTAAMATAEQQTGGKAVEVGYENENGQMLFEVKVAKDKAVEKVMIDAATGKVVKIANAEHGEHEKN